MSNNFIDSTLSAMFWKSLHPGDFFTLYISFLLYKIKCINFCMNLLHVFFFNFGCGFFFNLYYNFGQLYNSVLLKILTLYIKPIFPSFFLSFVDLLKKISRVGTSNFGPSPLSSRHGSQESLRHFSTMGSMSMLQTPTSSSRDAVAAAQKKKGIKSSLGRFFSKKEKVQFLSHIYFVFFWWSWKGRFYFFVYSIFLVVQVKGVKDAMPDGSTSMMSMSGLSVAMSDIDSNYDVMSISGGKIVGKSSTVDYGRQKKK